MKLRSLLLTGLIGLCFACTPKDDYDVYLMIGQSNMAGRGRMIDQDTIPIKGVYLLNDSAKVEPAVAPLNKYSTIRKGIGMQQISLANNFSAVLHEKTGRKILLVMNARGGSSIKEWSPNVKDNYVDKAIARTKDALHYGELKGIIWHQGETDASDPSFYMDSLKIMVSHIRKELNAEEVPFVAGEIAHWFNHPEAFNTVIHGMTDEIPHSAWVSSEGCSWLRGENDPHFSRDGQMLLGKRYAETVLDLVY